MNKLALVLMMVAPMRAQAMLVTIVSPVIRESEPFAAPSVIAPAALPAAPGSCGNASKTIDALEGAIVEAQAQYWAYLMKQPGFSGSHADIPGADIANPEIKTHFYSRLRFWLRQDSIPKLPPETLEKLNDVSQTIHMVTGLCG